MLGTDKVRDFFHFPLISFLGELSCLDGSKLPMALMNNSDVNMTFILIFSCYYFHASCSAFVWQPESSDSVQNNFTKLEIISILVGVDR
jgi:hypothetical protein